MDDTVIRVENEKDYLATFVSYKLGLTGPSITIQSSCSSSMACIHYGCQSLLNGECDIAVAGGISVRFPQKNGYLYNEDGILSPDGHVRTFDESAKGMVFGNGCGVVVLKRLEDAIEDKDHIYAVIKASTINNDGIDKIGYTAPSVTGQQMLLPKLWHWQGWMLKVLVILKLMEQALSLVIRLKYSLLPSRSEILRKELSSVRLDQ